MIVASCLANAVIIFTCTASSNGSSKIPPRDNAQCVDKSLNGTNSPGSTLQVLGLQWPRQHSNSSWKRPTIKSVTRSRAVIYPWFRTNKMNDTTY
ncbi:hypothetical protein PspLS_06723 [Pyricularia sp. CBS 133598]|nr:hypothetical protein PspLS_06723 [Pyricularia sp. CBS 133598]